MTPQQQEILDTLKQSLVTEREALRGLEGVLLGEGYVVVVGRTTVRVAVENGHAVDASVCSVSRATRFTKADAEHVAANVKNGHGEVGRAVHVIDALKQTIAEQAANLLSIEKTLGVVKAGQSFVIRNRTPYAAAVPSTDMGEQRGGLSYWTGDCWSYDKRAARVFADVDLAASERERLTSCPRAEVVPA